MTITDKTKGIKLEVTTSIIALIGADMFGKLLDRAFGSLGDVCVCKLRRGIKFSFYCK